MGASIAVTELSMERSTIAPPQTNSSVITSGIPKPDGGYVSISEALNLSNEAFNTYKVCKYLYS